ncbi:phage tail tape measure protein [compost metagenome]
MSTPRNLKLEVLLQAVDRVTRPFRSMMGSSSELARAVKATRDQLKDLNRTQANIDGFRKLSKDAAITGNQLRAAQARVKALAQEIGAVDKPTAAMTRGFQTAVREAQALKQRGGELQQNLAAVRGRLEAAGISTTSLGQAQRDLRGQITSTSQALAQQEARLRTVGERQRQMAAAHAQYQKGMGARNAMLNAGVSTMAAGGVALTPIAKAVKDYVSFEDAMLGIARQVEGARDNGGKLTQVYYDMAREIKRLGEELPIPTTAIAEMVTAGARMEVPRNELIAYTRTVAMMATAFDAVPDEIAESMGKVAKNFRIPTNAIMGLADTINYLDDNSISKGSDIINVLNRISGVVSTVAMPAADAAALASTLLTLGDRTETAGTAINAITQKFAAAEKGTKKFHAAVAEIGLTTQQIQKGMATDATGTLFKVVDAVRKLPKDKRIGVMVELVGLEHSDTLAKLVDKPDEFRRQLELANGSKAKGSMGREFAARQETVSARWQRLQNQVFNSSSAGGEVLRSTIVGLMDSVGNLISRFQAFAQANPALVGWLIKGAAAAGVLLTMLGGLTLAMAAALGPMVIARYGMAMLGVQMGGGVGIAARLATAFNFLMKVVGVVGRVFLLNPIGLAVTAIGVAAYLLYKYWEPVKGFFTGLWNQVTAAFQGGLTGVLALVANWSLMGALYNVVAPVLRWFGFDLPARFSEFGVNLLQGLVNGITSRLGSVRDTIVGIGDSVVGWFKERLGIHSPSRVFAQLGGFTMAGLEQGLEGNQAGPLGVVSQVAKALAGIGAGMAIGTGQAAGKVAIDTRPPITAAGSTGAAAPADALGPVEIHIHPPAGTSEQLIARMVADEIRRLEAQRGAQARSRLTDRD